MKYKTGIICGAFDLIHPGYIYMILEAKELCHELKVLVHDDPSLERPGKLKPIMSVFDRTIILSSLKFVDQLEIYNTEKQLKDILNKEDYQVRFLGADYIGKAYTKDDKDTPVVYLSREHNWSTTKLIELIVKRGLPDGTKTKDIQAN